MSKPWMKLFKRKESEASKDRRYQGTLAEIKANPPEGRVSRIIELEERFNSLARRMNPTPEERARIRQVEEFKDSAMLGQKDKYITVEYRSGQVYLDPYKAIKSYWLGDKKIWQNPDYEKGGRYYE